MSRILEIIPQDFVEATSAHPNDVGISEFKMTYTQEQDNESPIPHDKEDQYLKIEAVPVGFCTREEALEGKGYYYVMSTERWAIEDIDDIITILQDFKSRLHKK